MDRHERYKTDASHDENKAERAVDPGPRVDHSARNHKPGFGLPMPDSGTHGRFLASGIVLLVAGLLLLAAVAAGHSHMDDMDDMDMMESGDIEPGESWSTTFEMHGEFHYHCMNHPDHMEAMITIEMAQDDHEPVEHTVAIIEENEQDLETYGFDPMHLTIKAGDTVSWVNDGVVVHNVMEEHDDEHSMSGEGPAPYIPGPAILLVILGSLAMLVVLRARKRA